MCVFPQVDLRDSFHCGNLILYTNVHVYNVVVAGEVICSQTLVRVWLFAYDWE